MSDPNNAIVINPPILNANGNVVTVRFSFPAANVNEIGPAVYASSGLNYGQYIGLAFPSSMGAELLLDQGATPKFTCALSDGTNTYAVTAVKPTTSTITTTLAVESHIAYCRLDDKTTNVPLKVGPAVTYVLSVSLTSTKFTSTNFIRTVSLFTSTSNQPEKMIIDSIPVIGTAALYSDYSQWTTKGLDIISAAVTVTQGPSAANNGSIVYPYNQFDVTLGLKSNVFINSADHIIVFQYPNNVVTAATTIVAPTSTSTDPLLATLKGTLAISPFNSNSIILSGLGEDLIPGRQFSIQLKGWKANDLIIGGSNPITVNVYYKNTYSILSSVSNNIFVVQRDVLTLTANHPESWDVYRGGAWPITFTLKTTNDLTNGGWVVIQQTNTRDSSTAGGNKLTFISSTCDFSGNDTSFDNSYSKRPMCYPLRTLDTAYGATNPTTTDYSGSGFFFKLKGIISSAKTYYVTVWAFFDLCGAIPASGYPSVTVDAQAKAVPKFMATIYKNISYNDLNESRFTSNQIAISQSVATDFTGVCWNTIVYADGYKNSLSLSAAAVTAITLTNTGSQTTKVGLINYKEAFDWYIYGETYEYYADIGSATPLLKAIATGADTPALTTGVKYLYSSSSPVGSQFFQASYESVAEALATYVTLNKIPLPVAVDATPAIVHPSGRFVWQFPINWFDQGTSSTATSSACYAGWTIASNQATAIKYTGASYDTTNSVFYITPYTTLDANKKIDYTNTISAIGFTTSTSATIDSSLSNLPPVATTKVGKDRIVKIVSTYFKSSAPGKWVLGNYGSTNANELNKNTEGAKGHRLGLFSSCVKWKSTLPAITSLYTYIDIQIQWWYKAEDDTTSGLGLPLSNLRLIKLFPETGVFQDVSKNYSNTNIANTLNPYINHVVYPKGGKDADTDLICLIELNGKVLQAQKEATSNTLVMWLFMGTLLETDYDDTGATYPAAPLNSAISLYGLQSGMIFDSGSNNLTKTQTTDTALANLVKLNADIQAASTMASLAGSSAYIYFFGSILYFTTVPSSLTVASGTEKTLYVPYYCPRFLMDNAATPVAILNKLSGFYPLMLASYINSSAFNNISSLNQNVVAYNFATTASPPVPNTSCRILTSKPVGTVSTTKQDFKKDNTATSATIRQAMLRFGQYTATDNNLYVYNGYGTTSGTATTCSGHVLLLSSSMIIDTTVTASFAANFATVSAGTLEIYNPATPKNFYAFGRLFNKGMFYGLNQLDGTTGFPDTNNMAALAPNGTNGNNASSNNYFLGVKKPTVDSFVNGSNLVLTDLLGYSCVAVSKDKNEGLTNYTYASAANTTIRNFLLDWNPNTSQAWITTSISFDNNNTDVIKADIAGNFKTTLAPPVAVPANTNISFSSAALGANAKCGLMNGTNNALVVTECTVSSGTASCILPIGGTSFNICCYNVVISDTIAFTSVTATYPIDSGSTSGVLGLTNKYLTTSIYTGQTSATPNPFSFTTKHADGTDVINTKNASISAVTYSQVIQESGIGKVTFTVSLPRSATRDMKISLVGDLSSMLVVGNVPRCYASFTQTAPYGTTWDNGDVLVDTCSSRGVQTGGNSAVVVTTKAMVYKCGQAFAKTLYISLWPILVVNWTTTSANKSFKINMQLNSGDSTALNNVSFNMAYTATLAAKPLATGSWDSLCAVSSITPRIPGEVADYVFDFDLDTSKSVLSNTSPNEVSIFFPYEFYGSYLSNISCYYSGLVNCSFTDEGILNIRFSSNLPIGSGKKISITVAGIVNPTIDTEFSFPCTINSTNFSKGERINLITGSGKSGTVTISSTAVLGNLRFLQSDKPVSPDKNPRSSTTHKFRVTFDRVTGPSSDSIIIDNTPVLYVYFPSEYKLAWYNNKPTATIDEYSVDSTTNLVTKSGTYSPANLVLSGNRVAITFTQTKLEMKSTFRYWDISILNIVNPPDTTVLTGPPAKQTTRPYFVTLTNSNLSSIYRTYTNVNSYVSEALTVLPDKNFPNLGWNRGNSFLFDNSKWVIDIYSTPTQLNTLTIKSGRFLQSYFSVRTNPSVAIKPSVTIMSLVDSTFKTSTGTYSISTSFNQAVSFWVGCTCGTAPGYYLVNFSSSDTNVFAPLSPVVIIVDTTTKGVISTQTPPTIPAAGSVWVGIILSEPNFDQLAVNWTANDTNDATAKLTSVNIPAATVTPTTSSIVSPVFSIFSITNNSQTLPAQTFKTTDPSNCYTWNNVLSISFTINGTTADIPNNYNLTPSFKYANAVSDTTITVKNSVKFTFTAPFSPIYIFCALVCFNQSYPADNLITQVPQTAVNSSYLQYYANIVNNNTPIDITFSNLVRGMQYKLRCLIYSTHGDVSKRTSSNVNIESYTQPGVSNSTVVQILPAAPQSTQCVQWQFTSEPGTDTRLAVVNYCQKLYSTPGWWNNGCIICTYSDMTYTTPGLSLPTNVTCSNSSSKRRLRWLQNATGNATAYTPTTLTVCPVAHPVCATDVSGNKVYTDYFNQLINDLKTNALFKSTLGIDNVFLNTTIPTITITDSATPDLTKITATTPNASQNGAVSWTATFATPLACVWQISEASAGTPSSYNNVKACTDASWCGSAKVGATPTTIATTNLKAFNAGSSYNIFMACTNDIPMAQRLSNVQLAGTFSIPAPPQPSPSVNSTVTPSTGSSSFISFSVMSVLMILAFLL